MTTHPEAPALALYIRAIMAAGFTPHSTNNGGEDEEPTPTIETMLAEATAADEAHLYFTTPNNSYYWLHVVFGNSPSELVADFTDSRFPIGRAFTRAIESTSEALEASTVEALQLAEIIPPPITAAPWELHENYSVQNGIPCQSVRTPDFQWIAHVPLRAVVDKERDAIARAIAAIPQLLAALETIHANAAESPEWIRRHTTAALTAAGYRIED